MVDTGSVFVTLLAIKAVAIMYLAPDPWAWDSLAPVTIRPLKDKSQDRWAKKKKPVLGEAESK